MKCDAFRVVAVLGFVVFAMTAIAPAARAECVPWKSAGKIIKKEGLVPGGEIYKKAKSKGKVISAKLCEKGSKYVYKVKVLGKKGDVKTLTVDAKSGKF